MKKISQTRIKNVFYSIKKPAARIHLHHASQGRGVLLLLFYIWNWSSTAKLLTCCQTKAWWNRELSTTVLIAKTASLTLHHFSCKATQSALCTNNTSDHRLICEKESFIMLWPALCFLLSPVIHCPHGNSVYSAALSQKLENHFLPLANTLFRPCGTTKKASVAFHLLLCLHVNVKKVSKSVHNTEKMSS